MKKILLALLPALIVAGCSKISGDKVSSIDVTTYAYDTFPNALENISKVEFDSEVNANELLNDFLDSLNLEAYISDKHNRDSIYADLKRFYSLQDNELVWYNEDKPSKDTDDLLTILLEADKYALDSADYNVYKIVNLQHQVYQSDPNPLTLVMLDVRTSIAYITFAWHLHNGKSVPAIEEGLWLKSPGEASIAKELADNSISSAIESLQPTHKDFKPTLLAYHTYRKLQKQGGWQALPPSLVVSRGDTSVYVSMIRQRLTLTNDYSENESDSVFSESLENAVKKFQFRHRMEEDGVVGNTTLSALNIPVEQKIEVLKKNIERIRWMPNDLGDRYITVNIPEYELVVYDGNEQVMTMAVVVGEEQNKTPIFHDKLEYIVFSPTWTVPKSIVTEEMLPAVRKDKKYLSDRNIKVFDGWGEDAKELNPKRVKWDKVDADSIMFVQDPGTTNSLGRIKFMMPNSMAIYLHDTPANHLFNENDRAFSHGCIRVEKPIEFASYLLGDQEEWDEQTIRDSLNLEKPKNVILKEHVPVYIIYRTAWATEEGIVHFREDVYGFDKENQINYAKR